MQKEKKANPVVLFLQLFQEQRFIVQATENQIKKKDLFQEQLLVLIQKVKVNSKPKSEDIGSNNHLNGQLTVKNFSKSFWSNILLTLRQLLGISQKELTKKLWTFIHWMSRLFDWDGQTSRSGNTDYKMMVTPTRKTQIQLETINHSHHLKQLNQFKPKPHQFRQNQQAMLLWMKEVERTTKKNRNNQWDQTSWTTATAAQMKTKAKE